MAARDPKKKSAKRPVAGKKSASKSARVKKVLVDKPDNRGKRGSSRANDMAFRTDTRSSGKPNDRKFDDKKSGDKPYGERSRSPKSFGESRGAGKSYGDKTRSDKPFGEKR